MPFRQDPATPSSDDLCQVPELPAFLAQVLELFTLTVFAQAAHLCFSPEIS